jgi:ABC-type multidrug transport system ATPase subunit
MIEVKNLEKHYGRVHAVKGLNFTLNPGDFVGFVGGNGAGKSTTIKMLTGQLTPTTGSIRIGEVDIVERPQVAREKIGYVPEFPELYTYLTGREMLEFVCSVRQSDSLNRGIDIAGLGSDIDRLIREYSQGMRRKMAIACALVASPPILILDEALNGLDPSSVKRITGLLEEEREKGTCIVLSTHVLDTLEKRATRLLYIDKGELISDCGIEGLSAIRDRL